jgi:hypothetical protein
MASPVCFEGIMSNYTLPQYIREADFWLNYFTGHDLDEIGLEPTLHAIWGYRENGSDPGYIKPKDWALAVAEKYGFQRSR